MDDYRSTDPLTDSTLEHEIEAALSVEPSPEFLARVRTRMASEPAQAVWRLRWAVAVTGVVLTPIAILIVLLTLPRSSVERDRVVIPAARVQKNVEPAVTSPPSAVDVTPLRLVTRGSRVPARLTARRTEPEVLISSGEAAALRKLFADISERRIESSLLPDALTTATALTRIREIAIEPITVNPLAPIGSV